jgi:hypothetical protein
LISFQFQQFNANANTDKPAGGPFAAKAAELFTNDMIVGYDLIVSVERCEH